VVREGVEVIDNLFGSNDARGSNREGMSCDKSIRTAGVTSRVVPGCFRMAMGRGPAAIVIEDRQIEKAVTTAASERPIARLESGHDEVGRGGFVVEPWGRKRRSGNECGTRMGSEGTGVTSESGLPCTESQYPRKQFQADLVHGGGGLVASVVWRWAGSRHSEGEVHGRRIYYIGMQPQEWDPRPLDPPGNDGCSS
jgi:hypothetical protein